MKNRFWVKYRYTFKPEEWFAESMDAEDTIDVISLAEQGLAIVEEVYLITE